MPTKRLTKWDKEKLQSAVNGALESLLRVVCDPVADSTEFHAVYRDGWTHAMRQGIEAIEAAMLESNGVRRQDSPLNRTYHMTVWVGDGHTVNCRPPAMGDGQPVLATSVLPKSHPKYAEFVTYCETVKANRALFNKNMNFATGVINSCSAAGQLSRVFPFLEQFMPDDARSSLKGQLRSSSWPKQMDSGPEFRQQSEELHNALALAALITPVKSILTVS